MTVPATREFLGGRFLVQKILELSFISALIAEEIGMLRLVAVLVLAKQDMASRTF